MRIFICGGPAVAGCSCSSPSPLQTFGLLPSRFSLPNYYIHMFQILHYITCVAIAFVCCCLFCVERCITKALDGGTPLALFRLAEQHSSIAHFDALTLPTRHCVWWTLWILKRVMLSPVKQLRHRPLWLAHTLRGRNKFLCNPIWDIQLTPCFHCHIKHIYLRQQRWRDFEVEQNKLFNQSQEIISSSIFANNISIMCYHRIWNNR